MDSSDLLLPIAPWSTTAQVAMRPLGIVSASFLPSPTAVQCEVQPDHVQQTFDVSMWLRPQETPLQMLGTPRGIFDEQPMLLVRYLLRLLPPLL